MSECNLYFVLSEQLEETVWIDRVAYLGHNEPYCIAELVLATSPGQAKWMAWKTDENTFTGNVKNMPKMSVRKIASDFSDLPPRVVSQEHYYEGYWEDA